VPARRPVVVVSIANASEGGLAMTAPNDKSNEELDDLELVPETVKDLELDDVDQIRGGIRTRCSDVDSGCL
jgi:hypothetical protein